MTPLKNVFKLALILLSLTLYTGCARTVTDKSTLLRMQVTINFAGPVDTSNYYYHFIVGSSIPLLPEIPPFEYFPTPGKAYDQTNTTLTNKEGDILFYYQNYFDTWSDYYVIHNNQIEQYQSGSSGFPSDIDTLEEHTNNFAPVQRLQIENFTISGSQITFTVFTQDLSVSSGRIFFNIFTTKHEDHSTGIIQDRLSDADDPNLSILRLANLFVETPSDVEDSSIDQAADITTWRVLIF